MANDDIQRVTTYELGYRKDGQRAVVWLKYRDPGPGGDSLEFNDASAFAACASVLSSGLPVYYRKSDKALSTDRTFSRDPDPNAPDVSEEDFLLVSWSQLTWSEKSGGLVCLHLDNDDGNDPLVFITTENAMEFTALSSVLASPTPVFYQKVKGVIKGRGEVNNDILQK